MNVCSLAKGCRFRAILLACILMVPLSVQGQLGPPQPCAQTNDTVTTLTPTLRWHAVPDADSYQIKIFQTTHGVLILRVKDDTTEAKYDVPPGNLLHFNSYKWKVRAVRADANATELSPWSPEQTLKMRYWPARWSTRWVMPFSVPATTSTAPIPAALCTATPWTGNAAFSARRVREGKTGS